MQTSVNKVIIEEQHGFYPGRSTNACNLLFTNYVLNAYKERSQVNALYIDFNKAFDSINHDVLLTVLKTTGFGKSLLTCFRSYLLKIYQWVKVHGTKSNLFLASSGVPQGGHLSPILFSLFVNGVSRTLINCKLLCFADDMKLFM